MGQWSVSPIFACSESWLESISMRLVVTIELILALFFVADTTRVGNANGDYIKGKVGQSVLDYVELVHENLGFSGVVLAGKGGKVVAAIPRGQSDPSERTEMTFTSLFEIASCTKPFTAIAIMQLAERGKLELDDPISKHLPGVPNNCSGITIRHLLTHTSGIPGTNSRGAGDDIQAVMPMFLAGGPKAVPGTRYEYWNQGYSLLSEIIAQVGGVSYVEFVRREIFRPCGMESTRFTGDDPPKKANVCVGTSTYGAPRSALEHPYGSYGFQYRGMGGIVSNVQDLWKWDRALASGKLLSQNSFQQMTKVGLGNYGIGWRVGNGPDGKLNHGHGGKVRGFLAEVRRYPSIDGAIIILSNQDEGLPMSILRQGVERILFGEPTGIEWPSAPQTKWKSQVFGEYRDNRNRTLTIAESDGYPTLKINWGGPITAGYLAMAADHKPHLFMIGNTNGKLDFKDDGSLSFVMRGGQASSVSLSSLNPPVVFHRD